MAPTPKPGYRFTTPVPQQALDYLQAKRLRPGFDYRDVWREEHANSFTVAKMMELDLLGDVQQSLSEALANGTPFKAWAQQLTPTLQKAGWWGVQEVTDPTTGLPQLARLGTPRRLHTIYQANMRTARATGQWERAQQNRRTHPYLRYELGPSQEHRPEHAAWAGVMLPVNDAWWNTHMPPNGWGCKCRVRPVSKAEARRNGWEPQQAPPTPMRQWQNRRTGQVEWVPQGIDPGWDTNPGKLTRQLSLVDQLGTRLQGAPLGIGAKVGQHLSSTLQQEHQAGFTKWASGLLTGNAKAKNTIKTVGALHPALVNKLADLGVHPTHSAITLTDHQLLHMVRERKRSRGASLPSEFFLRLPNVLAQPSAVLWDTNSESLWYVFNAGERSGKAAVRVNFRTKSGDVTNSIRTAGLEDPAHLQSKRFILLEGELK